MIRLATTSSVRERRGLAFWFFGLVASLACASEGDEPPAGFRNPTGSGGSVGSGHGGASQHAGASGTNPEGGGTSGEDSSGGTDTSGGESGHASIGDAGDSFAAAGNGASGGAGKPGGGAGSGPHGDELCGDGFDNDGDGAEDCRDTDCAEACASCDSVELIADPTLVETSNGDRPAAPPSDCTANGPALIYEVVVARTGWLEVEALGSAFLRASISADCDDVLPLSCGFGHTSAEVTAGQRRFVRIAGLDPADVADITLSVHSRAGNVCADGYHDPAEACDDGNDQPGDGCDASCAVEASETEPNGARETADEWSEPFYAEIAPAADEDFVVFDVAEPGTLVAETLDLGEQACERGTLDSFLQLFDASGDLLASDDDGGERYCARLSVANTQAGRYFLRVSAASSGETPVFPYRLALRIE